MTPTARILPGDTLHADAARLAVQAGAHLVIILRTGQSAIVPQILPGMVRVCSADKQREAA